MTSTQTQVSSTSTLALVNGDAVQAQVTTVGWATGSTTAPRGLVIEAERYEG